jgi:DNA-binding NarL/FixJ family response regulator
MGGAPEQEIGAAGPVRVVGPVSVVPVSIGPVSVVVVDDHSIWRDGVARDLTERGFRVLAGVADGQAAVRAARALRPDVVVMDLTMPGPVSGVAATARITADGGPGGPASRVLVLSASGEQADVLEAVKAGASGYLVKSVSAQDLADGVRRVAGGRAVFTPGLAGLVLGEYRRISGAGAPALTRRETEVLRLVAKGRSARQIAEQLVLSHRTVENHVQSTLRKLQLHNRVELARYAIEHGLDAGADG